jgi:tetratricopeptide (TPR) repeat protein
MAERLGAAEVQANALITLGSLPDQAPQEALAQLTRAVQLAEGANLPSIAFRAHNDLAIMKSIIYGLRSTRDHLQRAVQLSQQTGNVAQEMLALTNILEVSLALGELEQAQTTLSRIRQLATQLDDPHSLDSRIRRLEAAVLLYQGEQFQSASLLRVAQAEARSRNDLQTLFNVDLLLARTLLDVYSLGPEPAPCDWDELERIVAEAMELGRAMGDADTNMWCRSYLIAVYVGAGRMEEARDVLAKARAVTKDWPFPSVEAALLWAEARLATAERRWAEALVAFETLADTYAQDGMRWERARTLVDWAATHAARGKASDRSQARSLLEESHGLFQEMGISRYTELVQDRLSALPGQA